VSLAQQYAYARLAGIDPPKFDPVTGAEEGKVRLRIRCRPTSQVLPGGVIVHRESGIGEDGKPADLEDRPGFNFAEVYESDAVLIEALVETATDEELARVEGEYERRCRAWAKANGGDEANMETCPHSREEAFAWVMGRGMLPLLSAERLGDNGRKGSKRAA
jgi:hypothetical protein